MTSANGSTDTSNFPPIFERAPSIDVASSSTGVTIGQKMLQRQPIKGRTFESLLAFAPGATDVAPRDLNGGGIIGGDVGVSISGATSNENNYIIDGFNVTDPNHGLIGGALSQNFIKKINVFGCGSVQVEQLCPV